MFCLSYLIFLIFLFGPVFCVCSVCFVLSVLSECLFFLFYLLILVIFSSVLSVLPFRFVLSVCSACSLCSFVLSFCFLSFFTSLSGTSFVLYHKINFRALFHLAKFFFCSFNNLKPDNFSHCTSTVSAFASILFTCMCTELYYTCI